MHISGCTYPRCSHLFTRFHCSFLSPHLRCFVFRSCYIHLSHIIPPPFSFSFFPPTFPGLTSSSFTLGSLFQFPPRISRSSSHPVNPPFLPPFILFAQTTNLSSHPFVPRSTTSFPHIHPNLPSPSFLSCAYDCVLQPTLVIRLELTLLITTFTQSRPFVLLS